MTDEKKPLGKVRHCWNCGADMGFIENRYYDRMDTCGKPECMRAERDALAEQRERAHDDLDRAHGWGDHDGRY